MERQLPSMVYMKRLADAGERERARSFASPPPDSSYRPHSSASRQQQQATRYHSNAHYLTPPNSDPTKVYDDLRRQDEMHPADWHLLPESSSPRSSPARSPEPPIPVQPVFSPAGPEPHPLDYVTVLTNHAYGRNALVLNFDPKHVQNYESSHNHAYPKAHYLDHDFRARMRAMSPASEDAAMLVLQTAERMRQQASPEFQALKKRTASMMASHATASPPAKKAAFAPKPRRAVSEETDDTSEYNFVPVTPAPRKRRRSSVANTSASRRRSSTNAKRSEGGKEAKSARAKSSKVQRSDNFMDYPDFPPPLDSINDPMEPIKDPRVYSHNKLDLSNDPDRHLLCEQELDFAAHLNLPCRKFLCVKRQLFEEFVKKLRGDSPHKGAWNKTRAQHCSNIDVTKTSQLFDFFENAGWWDAHHYKHLTDPSIDLSDRYYKGAGPGQ